MLTRRAQFSWTWWVREVGVDVEVAAAQGLVQTAAVHRPVGDQVRGSR